MVEKKHEKSKMVKMNSTDTTAESRRVLAGIYRQMPLRAKVERIFDAYEMGKQLAIAGLRLSHPHLNSSHLWRLWAKSHLGKKLFEEVYGTITDG
jgi:hypothetical protein